MLLPASSSAFMVGGPCSYETVYGIARITEQSTSETLARFYPQTPRLEESLTNNFRSLAFPVHSPISGKIGTTYPAALRVRTKGSCTPGTMNLLATEKFSRGTFIKFNDEGQPTTTAQRKISQIAMTFSTLASLWPHMHLEICGQTSPAGSEEYNLNLGLQYARKLAQQLEILGVTQAQIKTSSSGEAPCPSFIDILDEPQNGVYLHFILTDTVVEKF